MFCCLTLADRIQFDHTETGCFQETFATCFPYCTSSKRVRLYAPLLVDGLGTQGISSLSSEQHCTLKLGDAVAWLVGTLVVGIAVLPVILMCTAHGHTVLFQSHLVWPL